MCQQWRGETIFSCAVGLNALLWSVCTVLLHQWQITCCGCVVSGVMSTEGLIPYCWGHTDNDKFHPQREHGKYRLCQPPRSDQQRKISTKERNLSCCITVSFFHVKWEPSCIHAMDCAYLQYVSCPEHAVIAKQPSLMYFLNASTQFQGIQFKEKRQSERKTKILT